MFVVRMLQERWVINTEVNISEVKIKTQLLLATWEETVVPDWPRKGSLAAQSSRSGGWGCSPERALMRNCEDPSSE